MKIVGPTYKGENLYEMGPVASGENLITASGVARLEFTVEVLKKIRCICDGYTPFMVSIK